MAETDAFAAARSYVSHSVTGLVIEAGGEVTSRPMFRHDPSSAPVRDVGPADGMRAARAVELAARKEALRYIKEGRQDGLTWMDIGTALGITAGGHNAAGAVAEAAFDYAAGSPDSSYAQTYGRSFPWRCPVCQGLVSDRGPYNSPHDNEPGHEAGCERLAATVAAWDAQWEDFDG